MAAPGTPLRIFEIGGGTGTLARDILDHLRASVPDVYREVDYRMVEISPILAKLQERTVAHVGGHSDHFQVECRDAADLHGWESSKGDDPCFLLLLEVLDNCPHDRVHRGSPSQPWLQTAIREHQGSDSSPSTSGVEEVLQPLSDELIQQCLGCMVLLDALIKARPFHCILAADFDHLPETRIPGKNAPLVATTAGGKTIDHSTYLVDAGTADIFFPTDFYMLERMYGALSQRDPASEGITTSVLKNEAFMKRYASIAETTTVQGYNPLLQDYSNTSFLIGQRT
ncbi:hypothetical protein COCOBI_05-3440 [Coccomyxa sp. Obi]|nr:hypothetical protein COCOBI_05-3440 [Coccomyxa sp. Obi]